MHRIPVLSFLYRAVLFSLIGLLSIEASGQQPAQPIHGLWVWKTSTALAAPGSAEALRDFCRAQQINEVYVSFSSTGGTSGRAAENALLANLIVVLHKSKIRVEALLSSTDADEPGAHREKLLSNVREVVAFDQRHPKNPFDGIHLDIEPQQRPENKGAGNLNFLPGLVEAYQAANSIAAAAGLTVNADIQNKLLKGDLSRRGSLLTSLPRFTLMLYELSSPTDGEDPDQKSAKLGSAAGKYMEMAYQGLTGPNLAQMAIGLRAPDYDQLMPSMLATLDDTLRSNPHYLGWAWHSYNDHQGTATADGN